MGDIQSGQHFYERQQKGLGAYFLDSLFSDIDSLLLYAGIHQQFFSYDRALAKRFPYAIYYRVNEQNHSSVARSGLPTKAITHNECATNLIEVVA
jgi:hypothetical protein